MENTTQIDKNIKPGIRIAILVLGLVALLIISYRLTGSILPTDPHNSTIFQGGLLLIILGSILLEDKFT